MELTKEQNEVLLRARSLKGEIAETLALSHKTITHASTLLGDYYKSIPHGELSERIRMSFDAYDRDKSCALEREELREAMAEMGHRPDDKELDVLFDEWDINHSGTIEPDEFEHMVMQSLGNVHKCMCRTCAKRKAAAKKIEEEEELKRIKAMEEAEDIKRASSSKSGGSVKGSPSLNPSAPGGPPSRTPSGPASRTSSGASKAPIAPMESKLRTAAAAK